MVKVEFKVVNKCLKSYSSNNLTKYPHQSPYGIYGVVKNQTLNGVGVIKHETLFITWNIGGCTMIPYETAIELGFLIENL